MNRGRGMGQMEQTRPARRSQLLQCLKMTTQTVSVMVTCRRPSNQMVARRSRLSMALPQTMAMMATVVNTPMAVARLSAPRFPARALQCEVCGRHCLTSRRTAVLLHDKYE